MLKPKLPNGFYIIILVVCVSQITYAFSYLGGQIIPLSSKYEGQLQTPQKLPSLESYPQSRIEAIYQEQLQLELIRQKVGNDKFRSFISAQKTWKPGTVITVAFNGGSNSLRKQIADSVKAWSNAANISFDFGYSQQTGNFREWSTKDNDYSASIRISFNSESQYGTYWSAIGIESITRSQYLPNTASMNFGDLTDQLSEDNKATVLHEFGHALGFMHEHQSPNSSCEQEYRWSDDEGYSFLQDIYGQFIPNNGKNPGIYTVLGGPLNWWSKAQIDFNLRRFANSIDWKFSSFDKNSIMKYHFDSWMFLNITTSTTSGCYSPANLTLSAQDRKAASEIYPHDPATIKSVLNEKLKISNEVLKLNNLTPNLKLQIQTNISNIKQ